MVDGVMEGVLPALTAFTAVAILISGLDDLFIDCCYYGSELYRRAFPMRYPTPTEAELRTLPERPIAVMIPAWQEHAVIGRMLKNTLRTMEYANYDVFVGTYPNDEATMMAVAEVAEGDPRIHRIVCPRDGPTNKADCLNWIIEGIRQHEKKSGGRAGILVLHDSEDLVHPLSFKLINAYIPRASMVQLPVIPFESAARELTAGTYLDEFAESHIKDMVVRERISGMVPSAGVGTGFSREAVDRLAAKHGNQVFNVATFTEDYDLAFRLNALGEKSMLVRYYVERARAASPGRRKVERELVGTREYFPSNFGAAVRQKARWTLGIVFHGWQQRGWEGGAALRYMIWRDRKTLLTNSVNMLGYLLLLDAVLGVQRIAPGSWVWDVIAIDAVLLANRCVQRVVAVARVSSALQAVLSLPRIIWGNLINFFAVAKATQLFVRAAMTGKQPVWVKTAHAFPSEDHLLGEAHKAQKETGRLLGDILVDRGFAGERELVETLGAQLKVEDPGTP